MNESLSLFDANGRFGSSVNAASPYPAARDFLAEMNRLGVARAMVWHVTIATDHVPTANANLVAEIERTPGARGRLIPAFGFSAQMLYERGAMGRLEEMMDRSGSRALRFKPVYQNTLRTVEPVLTRLAARHPVVFIDYGSVQPQDLLAVAKSDARVRFVVTDVMWPQYINTFDWMRRAANILVENSGMHTWNAVEIAVREFGAERVLFGRGDRAHNGAAIAALACADISDEDRERIAHGNLERLLDLPPLRRPAAERRGGAARLWNRLMAGKPLGLNVVDAHYHLGGSGGYVLETNDLREQIAASLQQADRLGIRTMIVSGLDALLGADPLEGNRALARALKPYRGRFLAYFGFNPRFADILVPELPSDMPRFAGFKTLCDYWSVPIDDPRFQPMWEYADRHRLPILNHTWDKGYDSPAMLKDVVRKYPNAMFLLGHSGGGNSGRAEAEDLAAANDNVYLEWCGSFCSSVPWTDTLRKVGSRKVVYGSDAYVHGVPWELGRLLSLDVPDADLVPILGANIRRILARRR